MDRLTWRGTLRYCWSISKGYRIEEAEMTRMKMTRRDALGMIGKTGAALGTGTCFFLSLKTSPLAAADRRQIGGRAGTPGGPEKVVISGTGSTLTARISGPPGRHYGIAWATTDALDGYKALANAKGYIGENGRGTIQVDAKALPDGKVFLRVVTAKTSSFDEDVAGTEAFVVKISRGAIVGYEGVLSRPLLSAKGNKASAASFASAGYAVKRK